MSKIDCMTCGRLMENFSELENCDLSNCPWPKRIINPPIGELRKPNLKLAIPDLPALHQGCLECGAIMTAEEIEYLGGLCCKCEEGLLWEEDEDQPIRKPRFEPWP